MRSHSAGVASALGVHCLLSVSGGIMLEDFYLGNKTLWVYDPTESVDEIARNMTDQLKIPPLLSKVLAKRGIDDPQVIRSFLKPSVKNLHDPMLLPDMEVAVERILAARNAGERTIVYGDYDVDGITATSILVQFLKSIGMDVSFYIPDRVEEGYGISEAAVAFLIDNSYDLMITVDCGISAKDRLEQLQSSLEAMGRRMDVIITDHHQPNRENLPNALAVVNPHLPQSVYPFAKLCGAGIALKLVQALCCRLNLDDRYLDFIDLAALGTVADIVELTDENRIIVWAGLKKIQRRPNLGIQALLKVSEVGGREVDTWLLGYILGPRVNAAGRMGNASRGVYLFTSDDPLEAEALARQMLQDNALRQKTQEDILQKAIQAIEENPFIRDQIVIVVDGEGWHHGVIGIVASLLTERYQKPCFVLSVQGELAVGSARSVEGFNVFEAMEYCRELFVKYGGHEQAGGLTIRTADIDAFRRMVNEYAGSAQSMMTTSRIKIDAEVCLEDLTLENVEALLAMAPFGEGNDSPVFRLSQVPVLQKKRIGNSGDHLRLVVGTEQENVQAIAFRMGELEPHLAIHDKIDLVFCPGINEYMGKRSVQLMVKGIRVPETELRRNQALLEAAEKVECLDYDEEWIYNGINTRRVKAEDIRLSKDELAALYRFLQKVGSRSLNRAQLFHLAAQISQSNVRMNYFKLLSGMFIFDELDIIRFAYHEKGHYEFEMSRVIEKASLEDSQLYMFLQTLQQAAE